MPKKIREQILPQMFGIAFLCLFLSSCFLQTSSTTIKGYVRESDGKPVVDAEVSFGGVGSESKTRTDARGFYTVTAKHRPTQMLYLTAKKEGVGSYSDKFPGFAAPDGDKNIELMATLGTIPRTR
jgi:hypothetical protein